VAACRGFAVTLGAVFVEDGVISQGGARRWCLGGGYGECKQQGTQDCGEPGRLHVGTSSKLVGAKSWMR
jgi:hypothetical protein